MENRRPTSAAAGRAPPPQDQPLPPPPPPPSPSPSLLRDVSNYKTPRPRLKNPATSTSPAPIFFTAGTKLTRTPSTATRRRPRVPPSHSKAAQRLRELEVEQSRSSRRAQIRREKALKSFSGSITAWLNFLFENPRACGCDVVGDGNCGRKVGLVGKGKRESMESGVGGGWRSPKRPRSSSWCETSNDSGERTGRPVPAVALAMLEGSLHDVCSLEDLRERMEVYLSKKGCNDVLSMMTQVAKSIDDGRLRMKAHCPIVTDLGLRKKAIRILMCYNSWWLRIGLSIIFGGDSLLLNEDAKSENATVFKMIIQKLLLSHTGLAKSYAYNKLVEGLYKPGYFEALGSLVLKRFLLLALVLDKAKCESSIPLKCGIDGIDDGSPLLFCPQSHIKSTRRMVQEFLSEAMHGEGDLLTHLSILGYKVTHQQFPIAEYDFHVENLFEDIQDGVLLCRAIQLLKCDPSILLKLAVPSDTHKKKIQNCKIVMQYLEQAGVPLYDVDGIQVLPEDIAIGDKELILSLLWNVFVHLQVPLLIDKAVLLDEIAKIKGSRADDFMCKDGTSMDLFLEWIQAVCEIYHIKVDTFGSLVDRQVLHCLVDYYFRTELPGCLKEAAVPSSFEKSTNLSIGDSTIIQDIFLVQHVTTALGNFPEVIQTIDLLDEDTAFDQRSLTILLIFLASKYLCQKNKVDIKNILKLKYQTSPISLLSSQSPCRRDLLSYLESCDKRNSPLTPSRRDGCKTEEWAVQILQSHCRRFAARKNFLKIKASISLLQKSVRSWLADSLKRKLNGINLETPTYSRNHIFSISPDSSVERVRIFQIKKSVELIQAAVRTWIKRRHQSKGSTKPALTATSVMNTSAITIQCYIRSQIARSRYVLHNQLEETWQSYGGKFFENQWKAAQKIQNSWRRFLVRKLLSLETFAAIIVQSYWRGWITRRKYLAQKSAVIAIQKHFKGVQLKEDFRKQREAAIGIQQVLRGQLARKKMLGASSLHLGRSSLYRDLIRSHPENVELKLVISSILKLQRWWRAVLYYKLRTKSSIIIQTCIRQWIAQRKVLNMLHSICIIQRWWRKVFFLMLRKRSSVTIQSHFRSWIARKEVNLERKHIVVIQSYWRGYLVRKSSRPPLFGLQCRLKETSTNVHDDMKQINRLVAALSDLLGRKSVSNILQTCTTLDIATTHSQKCCEELVAAGAASILFKEVQLLTRSGPDQEVLKHALSTLRNIACYPHLARELIVVPQSVEIIFQELLRNKSQGYFVACELLRKLGEIEEGVEAICKLRGHVRRLHALVQNLEQKVDRQKRCPHLASERVVTEQRLTGAASLLRLISESHHGISIIQFLNDTKSVSRC